MRVHFFSHYYHQLALHGVISLSRGELLTLDRVHHINCIPLEIMHRVVVRVVHPPSIFIFQSKSILTLRLHGTQCRAFRETGLGLPCGSRNPCAACAALNHKYR